MPFPVRNNDPAILWNEPAGTNERRAESDLTNLLIYVLKIRVEVAVDPVPVRPRPQAEQLAIDLVPIQTGGTGQSAYLWGVDQVVPHLDPITGHP